MAERWWKLLHGFHLALRFWWLTLRVEYLRKIILRNSDKKPRAQWKEPASGAHR